MRSKTVLFVIVLFVGGFLFLGRKNTPRRRSPNTLARRARKPSAMAVPLARPMSRVVQKKEDDISPDCRVLHDRILALDLSTVADVGEAVGLEVPLVKPKAFLASLPAILGPKDACRFSDKSPFRSMHTEFLNQCGNASGDRAAMICFHVLQLYRSFVVDERTKNASLDSIKDEGTLVAKLAANFVTRPGRIDFEKLSRIADRLDEVSPKKQYEDFGVRMRYEQVLFTKDPAERARLGEELDRTGSPEVRVLLAESNGDYERMSELAEELKDSDPEKAEYYLAWADQLAGRTDVARQRLSAIAQSSLAAKYALEHLDSKTGKDGQDEHPFNDSGLSWGM